ncbi:MAG TPA: hypothetical protein VGL98_16825, partial [Gammaproteobacteria bacterium]
MSYVEGYVSVAARSWRRDAKHRRQCLAVIGTILVVGALLSGLPGAALAQSSAPAAAYAFDEGTGAAAADSSGNGLAGALTNGASWGAGQYNSGV